MCWFDTRWLIIDIFTVNGTNVKKYYLTYLNYREKLTHLSNYYPWYKEQYKYLGRWFAAVAVE